MADIIYYIVLYSVLGMACIVLCTIFYTIISALWEDRKLKKLIREAEKQTLNDIREAEKQTLNDIREANGLPIVEDPHTIEIGDRHADTIEKSFAKNDFRYSEEYWKYTFEDGESEKSDHPLNYEELKPLVDIHGPVKPDGLEVIKL